ncbi:SMI1/KNR4 family protein [Streptomyces sp. NPDC048442]|uniref:SMI1/KNR4 family protein n=1 Tax=Streptomyces sp. NPDC048442 TaxID=3154823 RepID=UPI0034410786
MDTEQLWALVREFLYDDSGELVCGEAGHEPGHVCVPVEGGPGPDAVVEMISAWQGSPRTGPTGAAGLPSLVGGKQVEWDHAWQWDARWVALGRTRTDASACAGGVARPLLVVAERTTPDPSELPPDASWLDRIVAVTGWAAMGGEPRTVDWAAVEARLGTRLPSDYKRLIETFGEGLFDGFLGIHGPEYLVRLAERYPAPDGRLSWAGNEYQQDFCWLPDGPDPDRWPVCVTEEDGESERFECSLTEAVFRYLTDLDFPGNMAQHFDVHWFTVLNEL